MFWDPQKNNKGNKVRLFRDFKNLFAHEKEKIYWTSKSNNCIKYESKSDRNEILSFKKYPNKIGPYLKVIMNNIKKPDTFKIQLTIAINFVFPKDNN